MKSMMKAVLRALTRACVELIESESGEFLTTREKSRLLDAMMREQREHRDTRKVVAARPNGPSPSVGHIQSA